MPSSRISSSTITSQNQGGGNKKTGLSIGLGRFSKNAIKRVNCCRIGPVLPYPMLPCDFYHLYAERLSDDWKNMGAYVPGVRPGDETAEYIETQYKYLCENNLNEIIISLNFPMGIGETTREIQIFRLLRSTIKSINDLCACRFLL